MILLHVLVSRELECCRERGCGYHPPSKVYGIPSSWHLNVCLIRSLTSSCSCDDKLLGFFHRKIEFLGLLPLAVPSGGSYLKMLSPVVIIL